MQDGSDMASLVAEIKDPREIDNPNVVKAIVSWDEASTKQEKVGRGLYFTRAAAPSGDGPYYHHIGIYGFTNKALIKYVNLKRSKLELERNLEQMRVLDNNMKIHVGLANSLPLSVDTEKDLQEIKKNMEKK